MNEIDVATYHALRPEEQGAVRKFLRDNNIELDATFKMVVEDLPSGAQRVHVMTYRRDIDGKFVIDVDGEVAFDVVTIYTDSYEPIV